MASRSRLPFSSSVTVVLDHPDGRVLVEDVGRGRKRVSVELFEPSTFMPSSSAETDYSIELIEQILRLPRSRQAVLLDPSRGRPFTSR